MANSDPIVNFNLFVEEITSLIVDNINSFNHDNSNISPIDIKSVVHTMLNPIHNEHFPFKTCKGINKNGNHCLGKIIKSNGFCSQHQNQYIGEPIINSSNSDSPIFDCSLATLKSLRAEVMIHAFA